MKVCMNIIPQQVWGGGGGGGGRGGRARAVSSA
jgi:hypothetical protein